MLNSDTMSQFQRTYQPRNMLKFLAMQRSNFHEWIYVGHIFILLAVFLRGYQPGRRSAHHKNLKQPKKVKEVNISEQAIHDRMSALNIGEEHAASADQVNVQPPNNSNKQPDIPLAIPDDWPLINRAERTTGPLHPLCPSVLPPIDKYAGKKIVLKLSWPLATRPTEGEMFAGLNGSFGVPSIIAAGLVRDADGRVIDTGRFISPHYKFSKILLSFKERYTRMEDPMFTNRNLYAVITETIGKPLSKAGTIRELVTAVLHAMFGELC